MEVSFTRRVTVTRYWERLGAGFHLFRSCVNPRGVPDNLTAAVTQKKTQESSSGGANHNCVVTVAGIAGNVPTRRPAGSGGGNSSKYIYVLFSPQRHLWSTVSFSATSVQFILPPSSEFPWNNRRLIWSTGKPGKSAGERKIFICCLCHRTPACWCA